jgi:hypothetical protein
VSGGAYVEALTVSMVLGWDLRSAVNIATKIKEKAQQLDDETHQAASLIPPPRATHPTPAPTHRTAPPHWPDRCDNPGIRRAARPRSLRSGSGVGVGPEPLRTG